MIDFEAAFRAKFGTTSVSAIVAVKWFYEEFYRPLEVKYQERGVAMRETGDVVRALYEGSEVTKRITKMTRELDTAKANEKTWESKYLASERLRKDAALRTYDGLTTKLEELEKENADLKLQLEDKGLELADAYRAIKE